MREIIMLAHAKPAADGCLCFLKDGYAAFHRLGFGLGGVEHDLPCLLLYGRERSSNHLLELVSWNLGCVAGLQHDGIDPDGRAPPRLTGIAGSAVAANWIRYQRCVGVDVLDKCVCMTTHIYGRRTLCDSG